MAEDKLDQLADQIHGRVALGMLGELKDHRIPVITGDTRNSVSIQKIDGDWVIGSTSKVMEFLELGTEAHEIRPKGKDNDGADGLFWEGANHPMKVIHHPGTKPQFIFRNVATDEALKDKLVKQALEGFE